MNNNRSNLLVFLGLGLLVLVGTGVIDLNRIDWSRLIPVVSPIGPVNQAVTQITYVHEKSEDPTPREVDYAFTLISLDDSVDILATPYEADQLTDDGSVSDQYKIAWEAGKSKMPCLVVQAGDRVLKLIELPDDPDDFTLFDNITSAADVLEIIR